MTKIDREDNGKNGRFAIYDDGNFVSGEIRKKSIPSLKPCSIRGCFFHSDVKRLEFLQPFQLRFIGNRDDAHRISTACDR